MSRTPESVTQDGPSNGALFGKGAMTAAQKLAMEMLSLEAIDLYIISEEVKDAFEDEFMRKDPTSWFEMGCAIVKAQKR